MKHNSINITNRLLEAQDASEDARQANLTARINAAILLIIFLAAAAYLIIH